MLEDFQKHLGEEEARRDGSEEQLEGSSKILLKVRSGIEHLSEKLKHLKAVSIHTFPYIWILAAKNAIQSDPLNSYSLNSSFSLISSGKFENFETITIDTNVKSTF